jgi:tight adherence protein B
MIVPYLLVGILVSIAVGVFLFGIGRSMEPTGELEERLEEWVQGGLETDTFADDASSSLLLGRMERTIQRQSFAESIKADLARADLSLTVTEYLLIRAAIVVLGLMIGYLIQRDLLSGLLLGAVGFVAPIVYVRMRQTRRLRAFNNQLPDVLDHMVGSLRAGYGLLQAVEWVSRQIPHPAGTEFDRVIREVQLGRSLDESLDSMVRRINSDDLALIITAIKIQHEVGGNLADILEIVAHTIRERVRIQREIVVLTSQQRYSGYVLMIMPIALAVILYVINPSYEKQLFTPGPTLCIPIGTVIMMVIGFFVMRRIVDIEV